MHRRHPLNAGSRPQAASEAACAPHETETERPRQDTPLAPFSNATPSPPARPAAPARRLAMSRIAKELQEIDSPGVYAVDVLDALETFDLRVVFCPSEGLYAGTYIPFLVSLPAEYPFEPPRVRVLKRVFHPNFDESGAVCLNILREDWTPVMSLNCVLLGITGLLLEPSHVDPLNRHAAELLHRSPEEFANAVRRTNRGRSFNGLCYDSVLDKPRD